MVACCSVFCRGALFRGAIGSAVVGAYLLMAACASIDGYPKRIGDEDQYVTEVNSFVSPDAILQYNQAIAQNATPAQLTVARNNIVTARIYAIDVNYHKFIRDLTAQQNVSAVGADWIVLGLAGAGATVGSAATKSTLAAISGGVTGARAAVTKDVFYSNSLPTVITQMEAQRKTVLAQIYGGLQKNVTNYTIYQALADLDNYYNAGTLNGALAGLATSAGANSQAGDAAIAATLSLTYSYDSASQLLAKYWGGNSDNAATIKSTCMKGLNTASVTAFIFGDAYAAQRVKCVTALNLQ